MPARLLRPTDTDTVRQLRCNTSNLELTQAFTDLIEHFHHKELSYWKDILLARQLSEENDNTFISDARATPVPSRENSPYIIDKERMKRPIGRSVLDFERRHKSESDDEEPELSLFNSPNPAAKKVKLEGTETANRMYEITPFKRLSFASEERRSSTLTLLSSMSRASSKLAFEIEPVEHVSPLYPFPQIQNKRNPI